MAAKFPNPCYGSGSQRFKESYRILMGFPGSLPPFPIPLSSLFSLPGFSQNFHRRRTGQDTQWQQDPPTRAWQEVSCPLSITFHQILFGSPLSSWWPLSRVFLPLPFLSGFVRIAATHGTSVLNGSRIPNPCVKTSVPVGSRILLISPGFSCLLIYSLGNPDWMELWMMAFHLDDERTNKECLWIGKNPNRADKAVFLSGTLSFSLFSSFSLHGQFS